MKTSSEERPKVETCEGCLDAIVEKAYRDIELSTEWREIVIALVNRTKAAEAEAGFLADAERAFEIQQGSRGNRMTKPATEERVAHTPQTVLVLRTCQADGTSHDGFKWPDSGEVVAPDWKDTAECGNGLHGWLWGSGNWSLKAQGENIKWLVLEVDPATIVDLSGKVKFPKCNVIASFTFWADAMKFIRIRMPADKLEKVATGDYGHASATGDYGHASATGDYGHASATGDYGHASATGDSGWAISTMKAKAAKNGIVTIRYYEEKKERYRVVTGYAGEDGIKADTWYEVKKGKLSEVKE